MRHPMVGAARRTVMSTASGATSAIIAARVAAQYARVASGALEVKHHDAGSSAGTKNDARRPIVVQYATRSGIDNATPGGWIVAATLPCPRARPITIIAIPMAALMAIGTCCGRFRAIVVTMKSAVARA